MAAEEIAAAIEVPANTDMGDFAYPCFKLAKVLRKAPPLIAQEIGEKLEKPDFIADVKIVGAYTTSLWTSISTPKRYWKLS